MLETLERTTRLRANDWTGARKFLDRVEAYSSASSHSLLNSPGDGAMLMSLIKRSVPEDWHPQFKTWCTLCQRRPNVTNFLRWASALVDPHLRDDGQPRGRTHYQEVELATDDSSPVIASSQGYEATTGTSIATTVCVFCGGSHALKRCEDFMYLGPEERKKFVMENGRCLVCLGTGHIADRCYSTGRCALCMGKHHSLVHTRRPLASSNTVRPSGPSPGDQEPPSNPRGVTSMFQGYISTSHLWSTN